MLLTLLVELHRKVDALSDVVRGEEREDLPLENEAPIEGINYEYFQMRHGVLGVGKRYYGRLKMPTFPQRDIPVFFLAESEKLGRIELIHERDRKEWDSYVASRERVMIRNMKRGES